KEKTEKLNRLIKELCPDGVEYKEIGNLIKKTIKTITPSIKIKKNDYKNTGNTPIISQEIEYISGYCDFQDNNIKQNNYICFGDHSEHIKYINFPFVQGADGLKILTTDELVLNAKYFYYAISNFYIRHNNYERHFKYLLETPIPVPPMPIQEEIVKILDRFDTLCNDLSAGLPAEIEKRQKQYEYFRDKLLTFKPKK
ncbi:MAG: restriction endonuclease subunit S, partial [bacterium]|nr:restriction endonuclease subunit S [bacterium]